MKIYLRLHPGAEYIEEDIKKGITAEDIYLAHEDEFEHPPMAAKINNDYTGLTTKVNEPCHVELIDMTVQAGRLIFQHGMIMIYLKAIEEVLGRSKVDVQYALSKGLYTEIDGGVEITDDGLAKIKKRMEEIVAQDIPFEHKVISREEGLKQLENEGLAEKKRMLTEVKDAKTVEYYSLGGFNNFFFGYMVPSTRYIYGFDLAKYRKGIILKIPHERTGSGLQYMDDRKLYSAFIQTHRWQEIMGTPYVTDLNIKLRNGEEKEIIQMSEALHEQNVVDLAKRIIEEKKRIILISGPSSSGKTTLARRLCIQLKVNGKNPLYLGTDDYFVEREDTPKNEKGEYDYECLEAVDVEMFNRDMNDLLAGKEVDLPTFDFMDGKKKYGDRITSINEDDPIVIEGIHALNGRLTPKIDEGEKFKVYISPLTQLNVDDHNRISVTDARMLRRIVRDHQFRGHSAKTTIKSWPNVRQGENVNVFPYNGEADVFINTMHVYELSVLKKFAMPLLAEITPEDEEYAEARRLMLFLRFFREIEHDEYIVNNSILREFIGGSIFLE